MPLLEHVKAQAAAGVDFRRGPAAIILAPTRELALQIFEDIDKYGYVRLIFIISISNILFFWKKIALISFLLDFYISRFSFFFLFFSYYFLAYFFFFSSLFFQG